MSIFDIDPDDLHAYEQRVLDAHLYRFTGNLILAAERRVSHTIYVPYFTLAVGGVALHAARPRVAAAVDALQSRNGLEVVQAQYPRLVARREGDWDAAVHKAWTEVTFRPDVHEPEDRTSTGYIELLEAISYHTARIPWHIAAAAEVA